MRKSPLVLGANQRRRARAMAGSGAAFGLAAARAASSDAFAMLAFIKCSAWQQIRGRPLVAGSDFTWCRTICKNGRITSDRAIREDYGNGVVRAGLKLPAHDVQRRAMTNGAPLHVVSRQFKKVARV